MYNHRKKAKDENAYQPNSYLHEYVPASHGSHKKGSIAIHISIESIANLSHGWVYQDTHKSQCHPNKKIGFIKHSINSMAVVILPMLFS